MKQLLRSLFLAFLISSCAQPRKENDIVSFKNTSPEAEIFADKDLNEVFKKVDFEKNTAQLTPLIKQKLQEYYDLLVLKETNPEFSDEIKEQLKKLSDEKLEIASTINPVSIKNILFISALEKVSDSIQKVKFSYERNSKKDSLTAIIKSSPIKIEDQIIWNTQILFKKAYSN